MNTMSTFLQSYRGLFDPTPSDAEYVRMAWLETPLGPMLAGTDSTSLRFLEFTDRRAVDAQIAALRRTSRLPLAPGECALTDLLRAELASYFAGKLRSFSMPVSAPGTPFQSRVWQALRTITYGSTKSYGEIAKIIGSPGASRAVGAANGLNRVAIVIPCHRVVNTDGSPGGYGAGLERKLALLALERKALG
jgi:AraC family transcriptional regulator of adaptative response/methylated-DNA-[protein]-cysteine methyltransferase